MDKTLLTLLVSQAMNSARDVPNDQRALGKLGPALDLAVDKLILVWGWGTHHVGEIGDGFADAEFKLYASQARECMRKAFGSDQSVAEVYARADLILETAADEFDERYTNVDTEDARAVLTVPEWRAAIVLAFNVLTELNQLKPAIHSQIREATKRLTPLVREVIDA